MQLNAPRMEEALLLAGVLAILWVLGQALAPRFPRLVRGLCAPVLAMAFLSAWNAVGSVLFPPIAVNGYTVCVLAALGLPGLSLLCVLRVLL